MLYPYLRWARLLATLGLGLVGCHAGTPIPLPAPEAGEQTFLGVIKRGEALHFEPIDLRAGPAPTALSAYDDAELVWLYYRADFEQLFFDLSFGDRSVAEQRPIPHFDRGFGLNLGSSEARAPSELDWFVALRIPAPAPPLCAERGGCYASLEDSQDLACQVPCPHTSTIAPPKAPAPTVLTPCADGWSPIQVGSPEAGATACAPPAVARPCAQGLPFLSGCEPVTPCPSDGWPANSDANLFVRASTAAGGDGSRARPFNRIAQALAAAQAGDSIAVAAGRYEEALRVHSPVAIHGACADGTQISFSTGPTVDAAAGTATISGVTIAGGPALVVGAGQLRLDAVQLAASSSVTVLTVSEGGALRARRVAIDGRDLAGLVESQGRVELTGASLIDARGVAITVAGASGYLALADARVATSSTGVVVSNGASLRLTRSLIEGAAPNALLLRAASGRISDVVIQGGSAQTRSAGIRLQLGAQLELERLWIHDRSGLGIWVRDTDSVLLGSDLIVSDVRAMPVTGVTGCGVLVDVRSHVALSRVFIAQVESAGLYATDITGAQVEATGVLSDVRVEDVSAGDGLVFTRTRWTVDRAELERVQRYGLYTVNGSQLEVRDLRVTDADQAIRADSAELLLARVALQGSTLGICANREGVLNISDLSLTGTILRAGQTCSTASPEGAGIVYNGFGELRLERFLLSGNEGPALHFLALPQHMANGQIRDNGYVLRGPEDQLAAIMVQVLLSANRALLLPL